MAQSVDPRRNRAKPGVSSGHRSRLNDEDSVRGPHQGQQSTRTAPTGRTHDCKRPLCGTPNDLLRGGGHPHMIRGSALPGTPQTQANGAHRRGLPSPTRKDYGSEAADDIFVAACHVCCLLRIYSTACSIAPARSHLKCQHTSFVSSVSPSSRISSKSP